MNIFAWIFAFGKAPVVGPQSEVSADPHLPVTSIFFVFPPDIPVTTGSEMNYVICVVAIALILCVTGWIVDGRKRYAGPLAMGKLLQMANRADVTRGPDDREETAVEKPAPQ